MNLVENLGRKLPNLSNKYGALSIAEYYSHLWQNKKIDLLQTEKDHTLQILRDIDITTAAGINRLSGRFLTNGSNVPAKPVIDTCNVSITLKTLSDCKG